MRKIDSARIRRPSEVNPGPAPILQWLKISDLVVDDAYQRELKPSNWKAIGRIAAGFRWSRFSPVFVAPVEGGRFAIIDGQHRVHAAAACGFAEVPCQIVQMTQAEQAAAFAAVNGEVTKVTVWHIYKAALTAGEAWAVEADRLATSAGCRLATNNKTAADKKPREIYAITTFSALMRERRHDLIRKALSALVAAEGYGDIAEIWDASIWASMVRALCQRPHVLERDELVSRLENFDIWAVIDGIADERRRRMRTGLPPVSKKEQLETQVLDWLDRTFPQRVAMPTAKVGADA